MEPARSWDPLVVERSFESTGASRQDRAVATETIESGKCTGEEIEEEEKRSGCSDFLGARGFSRRFTARDAARQDRTGLSDLCVCHPAYHLDASIWTLQKITVNTELILERRSPCTPPPLSQGPPSTEMDYGEMDITTMQSDIFLRRQQQQAVHQVLAPNPRRSD